MSARDNLRTVPHSAEAEQSVLGALLMDNDSIDRIGDLKADHFFRFDHRTIFAELLEMIVGGIGADPITLLERLAAKGKADDMGGLQYLHSLAHNTPSSANIARYASIVIDRAQKRWLLTAASEIEDSVGSSADSAEDLVDRAAAKIEALTQVKTKSEPRRASVGLSEHLNLLERRSNRSERLISTGLENLDKALNGGLRPGWVVVLAARPAMGKTALALNIADHVAIDHSSLFLSMEMPESELHDRNIASLGKVALDKVMQAPEGDTEFWERVTKACGSIKDLNLFIDDQSGLRLLDVRSKARLVKRKSGLDLLVIDYIQLMSGDGANRNTEIEGISRGLKTLAKELGIAILVLAQLNRKAEDRPGLPKLSDLRDSGAIEQDADVVMFLHREEIANPECGDQFRGFAKLRIAKFRHGRTTDVGLTYAGEFVRFGDHVGYWPEAPQQKQSRGGFKA